jgi:repressor LexA
MFLTERQLAVLNFIRDFIHDRGISPTLDEMSQYFRVSKITVYEHVNALEKKGAIQKTKNMARSITLVEDERAATAPSGPRGLTVQGRIAAGAAVEAIEDQETFAFDMLAPEHESHYMLRVEGDSMIGDHICPGDLVVVQPADTAADNDIVVAMMPDEASGAFKATLKRFFREKDHIRLQPSNDAIEPILVKDVEIRGKVVGVVRPRM